MLYVRKDSGAFTLADDQQVLDAASATVKRMLSGQVFDGEVETAKRLLPPLLAGNNVETMYLGHMDSERRLIYLEEKFRGTVDGISVPVREVVASVIKYNAEVLFMVHNHPRGNVEPSKADMEMTEHVARALSCIGVKLMDHYVVCGNELTSIREKIRAERALKQSVGLPKGAAALLKAIGEQMGVDFGGVAVLGPDGVRILGTEDREIKH